MDEFSNQGGQEYKNDRNEIFSQAVRAGKRTYFFDVKSTRKEDYYLTITESKKRFDQEGNAFFEKHKIFLYKEDFDKFSEGLIESINFIRKNQSSTPYQEEKEDVVEAIQNELSSIEFDDLTNS